ncbi:MAG: hypothetical protein ACI9R3_005671 [Verrucomicrobiales bacterium]|jgi:hypothetical protein
MARKRRKTARKTAQHPLDESSTEQGSQPLPVAGSSAVDSVESVTPDSDAEGNSVEASVPLSVDFGDSESGQEPIRVLAVFPDTAVLRLIRESMGAFTQAVVDTTPDAAFGFEMAMQRDYRMFFFGVDLPVLGGEKLYDFISKAYAHARPESRLMPGVVYLTAAGQKNVPHELMRDARVKGVLSCPFEISRLLSFTEGVIPATKIGA